MPCIQAILLHGEEGQCSLLASHQWVAGCTPADALRYSCTDKLRACSVQAFLTKALMPLHKPKCVGMYHQQLAYCVTQVMPRPLVPPYHAELPCRVKMTWQNLRVCQIAHQTISNGQEQSNHTKMHHSRTNSR